MAEFSVQDASLRCDYLTINQVPFPQTYPSISNFLKYDSEIKELVWDIASTSVANNEVNNEYLIMTANKGTDTGSVTMNPNSATYIRGGHGVQKNLNTLGGPDGSGTGINYTPKGQITIGLTKENADLSSNTNERGSSMVDFMSLSHKELLITDIHNTKYFTSKYQEISEPSTLPGFGGTNDVFGIDYPNFNSGLKLDITGYYKKENSSHIPIENTNEVLRNKILKDPIIDGTIGINGSNTSLGFESGGNNTGSYEGYTLSGTMRSDGTNSESNIALSGSVEFSRNLDYTASDIYDYYKGWTIQATTPSHNTFYDIVRGYPTFQSVIYGELTEDSSYDSNTTKTTLKIKIKKFNLYDYIDAGLIYYDSNVGEIKALSNIEKQTKAVNYWRKWKLKSPAVSSETSIESSSCSEDGTIHTIVLDANIQSVKGEQIELYVDDIFYGTMSAPNKIQDIGRDSTNSDALDFYKGWTIIFETSNIRQMSTINSSLSDGNGCTITYDRSSTTGFNQADAATTGLTKYQLIPPKRILMSPSYTKGGTSYVLTPPHNNRGDTGLSITGTSEVFQKKLTEEVTSSNKIYLNDVSNLDVGMILYQPGTNSTNISKTTTIQNINTEEVNCTLDSNELNDTVPNRDIADYYKGSLLIKNNKDKYIITSHSGSSPYTIGYEGYGLASASAVSPTLTDTFTIQKNIVHLTEKITTNGLDVSFYPVNKVQVFKGEQPSLTKPITLLVNDLSGIRKNSLLVETNDKLFERGTIVEIIEAPEVKGPFPYIRESESIIVITVNDSTADITDYYKDWIIDLTYGTEKFYGVVTDYDNNNNQFTINWDTASFPAGNGTSCTLYKNKYIGQLPTKITDGSRQKLWTQIDIEQTTPQLPSARQWDPGTFYKGWTIKILLSTSDTMQADMTLASSASNQDDAYNGMTITVGGDVDATGLITDYDGTGKVIAVTWDGATPTTTSSTTYRITTSGTVQEESYKLSMDAKSVDDFYNGMIIVTQNPDATGVITDYDGTTKEFSASWDGAAPTMTTGTTYKISTWRRGHITSHESTPNQSYINVDWEGTPPKEDTFSEGDTFILEKNEITLNNRHEGDENDTAYLFDSVSGDLLASNPLTFPDSGKYRVDDFYIGWNINLLGGEPEEPHKRGSGKIKTHLSTGVFTIDNDTITITSNDHFILTPPELTFINNEYLVDTRTIHDPNFKTNSFYSQNYYNHWNIEAIFPQPTISGISESIKSVTSSAEPQDPQIFNGIEYEVIKAGDYTDYGGSSNQQLGETFTANNSGWGGSISRKLVSSSAGEKELYPLNSIYSETNRPNTDDYFNGWKITISNPTDYGFIADYDGTTKKITIKHKDDEGVDTDGFYNNSTMKPGTTYTLTRPDIDEELRGNRIGKITSYTNNSDIAIHGQMSDSKKLDNEASTENDFYNNWTMKTRNPTDSGIIENYIGTGKEIRTILSDSGIVNSSFIGGYLLKNIACTLNGTNVELTTDPLVADDYYNGWRIEINGKVSTVDDYDSSNKLLYVAWESPSSGPPTGVTSCHLFQKEGVTVHEFPTDDQTTGSGNEITLQSEAGKDYNGWLFVLFNNTNSEVTSGRAIINNYSADGGTTDLKKSITVPADVDTGDYYYVLYPPFRLSETLPNYNVTGYYNNWYIKYTDTSGDPQKEQINSYSQNIIEINGTTSYDIPFNEGGGKSITLYPNFTSITNKNTIYELTPPLSGKFTKGGHTGTMTASLTLADTASTTDDFYNGMTIVTQTPNATGVITDYTGGTWTITVTWDGGTPTMTTSTTYKIYPEDKVYLSNDSSSIDNYYNGMRITTEKYGSGYIHSYSSSGKEASVIWDERKTQIIVAGDYYNIIPNKPIQKSSITVDNDLTEFKITDKKKGVEDSTYGTTLLPVKYLNDFTEFNTGVKYVLTEPNDCVGTFTLNSAEGKATLEDTCLKIKDYYLGWNIIAINERIVEVSRITGYNYETKIIDVPSLTNQTTESSTTTYTLIKNEHLQGTMIDELQLSRSAFPIKNYYTGWSITVKTDGITETGIITDYISTLHPIHPGKIIVHGLTIPTNNKTTYRLEPHKEGIIQGIDDNLADIFLDNNSMYINNYYNKWRIELLNDSDTPVFSSVIQKYTISDTELTNETVYQNGRHKITIVTDDINEFHKHFSKNYTKYRLCYHSNNTSIGYKSGYNIHSGSNNISLGYRAGPKNIESYVSNKLFIDNTNNGDESFIYGEMDTKNDYENRFLNIHADVKIGGESLSKKGPLQSRNLEVNGNITVKGDLTIEGNPIENTITRNNLVVDKPFIKIADGNAGLLYPADFGIIGEYGNSDNKRYSGLFYDTATNKWSLYKEGTIDATNLVDTTGSLTHPLTDGTQATLVANIEGNIISPEYDIAGSILTEENRNHFNLLNTTGSVNYWDKGTTIGRRHDQPSSYRGGVNQIDFVDGVAIPHHLISTSIIWPPLRDSSEEHPEENDDPNWIQINTWDGNVHNAFTNFGDFGKHGSTGFISIGDHGDNNYMTSTNERHTFSESIQTDTNITTWDGTYGKRNEAQTPLQRMVQYGDPKIGNEMTHDRSGTLRIEGSLSSTGGAHISGYTRISSRIRPYYSPATDGIEVATHRYKVKGTDMHGPSSNNSGDVTKNMFERGSGYRLGIKDQEKDDMDIFDKSKVSGDLFKTWVSLDDHYDSLTSGDDRSDRDTRDPQIKLSSGRFSGRTLVSGSIIFPVSNLSVADKPTWLVNGTITKNYTFGVSTGRKYAFEKDDLFIEDTVSVAPNASLLAVRGVGTAEVNGSEYFVVLHNNDSTVAPYYQNWTITTSEGNTGIISSYSDSDKVKVDWIGAKPENGVVTYMLSSRAAPGPSAGNHAIKLNIPNFTLRPPKNNEYIGMRIIVWDDVAAAAASTDFMNEYDGSANPPTGVESYTGVIAEYHAVNNNSIEVFVNWNVDLATEAIDADWNYRISRWKASVLHGKKETRDLDIIHYGDLSTSSQLEEVVLCDKYDPAIRPGGDNDFSINDTFIVYPVVSDDFLKDNGKDNMGFGPDGGDLVVDGGIHIGGYPVLREAGGNTVLIGASTGYNPVETPIYDYLNDPSSGYKAGTSITSRGDIFSNGRIVSGNPYWRHESQFYGGIIIGGSKQIKTGKQSYDTSSGVNQNNWPYEIPHDDSSNVTDKDMALQILSGSHKSSEIVLKTDHTDLSNPYWKIFLESTMTNTIPSTLIIGKTELDTEDTANIGTAPTNAYLTFQGTDGSSTSLKTRSGLTLHEMNYAQKNIIIEGDNSNEHSMHHINNINHGIYFSQTSLSNKLINNFSRDIPNIHYHNTLRGVVMSANSSTVIEVSPTLWGEWDNDLGIPEEGDIFIFEQDDGAYEEIKIITVDENNRTVTLDSATTAVENDFFKIKKEGWLNFSTSKYDDRILTSDLIPTQNWEVSLPTQIRLAYGSGSSSVNDFYIGMTIVIENPNAIGVITDYTAQIWSSYWGFFMNAPTVTVDWRDATSGTMPASGTLASSASNQDGAYNGMTIALGGANNATGLITDYDGTTRTIVVTWEGATPTMTTSTTYTIGPTISANATRYAIGLPEAIQRPFSSESQTIVGKFEADVSSSPLVDSTVIINKKTTSDGFYKNGVIVSTTPGKKRSGKITNSIPMYTNSLLDDKTTLTVTWYQGSGSESLPLTDNDFIIYYSHETPFSGTDNTSDILKLKMDKSFQTSEQVVAKLGGGLSFGPDIYPPKITYGSGSDDQELNIFSGGPPNDPANINLTGDINFKGTGGSWVIGWNGSHIYRDSITGHRFVDYADGSIYIGENETTLTSSSRIFPATASTSSTAADIGGKDIVIQSGPNYVSPTQDSGIYFNTADATRFSIIGGTFNDESQSTDFGAGAAGLGGPGTIISGGEIFAGNVTTPGNIEATGTGKIIAGTGGFYVGGSTDAHKIITGTGEISSSLGQDMTITREQSDATTVSPTSLKFKHMPFPIPDPPDPVYMGELGPDPSVVSFGAGMCLYAQNSIQIRAGAAKPICFKFNTGGAGTMALNIRESGLFKGVDHLEALVSSDGAISAATGQDMTITREQSATTTVSGGFLKFKHTATFGEPPPPPVDIGELGPDVDVTGGGAALQLYAVNSLKLRQGGGSSQHLYLGRNTGGSVFVDAGHERRIQFRVAYDAAGNLTSVLNIRHAGLFASAGDGTNTTGGYSGAPALISSDGSISAGMGKDMTVTRGWTGSGAVGSEGSYSGGLLFKDVYVHATGQAPTTKIHGKIYAYGSNPQQTTYKHLMIQAGDGTSGSSGSGYIYLKCGSVSSKIVFRSQQQPNIIKFSSTSSSPYYARAEGYSSSGGPSAGNFPTTHTFMQDGPYPGWNYFYYDGGLSSAPGKDIELTSNQWADFTQAPSSSTWETDIGGAWTEDTGGKSGGGVLRFYNKRWGRTNTTSPNNGYTGTVYDPHECASIGLTGWSDDGHTQADGPHLKLKTVQGGVPGYKGGNIILEPAEGEKGGDVQISDGTTERSVFNSKAELYGTALPPGQAMICIGAAVAWTPVNRWSNSIQSGSNAPWGHGGDGGGELWPRYFNEDYTWGYNYDEVTEGEQGHKDCQKYGGQFPNAFTMYHASPYTLQAYKMVPEYANRWINMHGARPVEDGALRNVEYGVKYTIPHGYTAIIVYLETMPLTPIGSNKESSVYARATRSSEQNHTVDPDYPNDNDWGDPEIDSNPKISPVRHGEAIYTHGETGWADTSAGQHKTVPYTIVNEGTFGTGTSYNGHTGGSIFLQDHGDRSDIDEYYRGLRIIVRGPYTYGWPTTNSNLAGKYAGGTATAPGDGGVVYKITSYNSSTREITVDATWHNAGNSSGVTFSAGTAYTITLTQQQIETRIGRGRAWITGEWSTRKPQHARGGNNNSNAYGDDPAAMGNAGDVRDGPSDYACFLGRIRNSDAGTTTLGGRSTSLSGYITAYPFYGEPGSTHYAKLEMASGGESDTNGNFADFKYYHAKTSNWNMGTGADSEYLNSTANTVPKPSQNKDLLTLNASQTDNTDRLKYAQNGICKMFVYACRTG